MNRSELEQVTREQMPAKRWQHTLGVMTTSVELAKRYGGNVEQAELAALLHDFCKYWPTDKLIETLQAKGQLEDLLDYDPQLLHGPAAALVVQEQFGIDDIEVLDAIHYHTSGRVGMTLLDKIVCLADYMEPGRDFPGVHNIREIAEHSLERALVAGFDSTIQFLLSKHKTIYPLTVLARNSMVTEIRSAQLFKEAGE